MRLEHRVIPQVSKNKNATLVEYVQGTLGPTERPLNGQVWNNLSNKVNKVVLDYNPKYKRNIHTDMKKMIE